MAETMRQSIGDGFPNLRVVTAVKRPGLRSGWYTTVLVDEPCFVGGYSREVLAANTTSRVIGIGTPVSVEGEFVAPAWWANSHVSEAPGW